MGAKFAEAKCEHCGTSLRRKAPENKDVEVITPRTGEPDFDQRLLAPCPSCGRYLLVVEETAEPEAAEPEGAEPTEA